MIHLLISIWKMLDWQHSLFHSFHNLAVTEGQPLFCSSNHIHVFCWVAAAAVAAAPAVSVAVTVLLQLSFECITPLIIDTARALLQLSVFWCSPFYRCCFGADFYFTFIHFILTTLLHSVSFFSLVFVIFVLRYKIELSSTFFFIHSPNFLLVLVCRYSYKLWFETSFFVRCKCGTQFVFVLKETKQLDFYI